MSFLLGGLRAPLPQFRCRPLHSKSRKTVDLKAQKQDHDRRSSNVQRSSRTHRHPWWRGRAVRHSAAAPGGDHPAHFSAYRKVLPQMSDTERDALEAGTVWWEGELFRGKPDWQKLHAYPVPKLTAESSPSSTTNARKPAAWSMTGR
jgi:hypothetical protein